MLLVVATCPRVQAKRWTGYVAVTRLPASSDAAAYSFKAKTSRKVPNTTPLPNDLSAAVVLPMSRAPEDKTVA